ncbi:MAG TPA: hypothetical protein VN317_08195 [Candidatus Methanoperedens sp.]|nr:hypothetical protein [Candidatus Methanoperedens sp.]
MSEAASRRSLLVALVLLALTALVLHSLAHPVLAPDKEHPGQTLFRGPFVAATLLPLIDLVVVTGLFLFRGTSPLAYLLNGMLVIYGTVLMGHFGIVGLTAGAAQGHWIFKSMLIDIALVWVDFLIGKALYESWLREA